MELEELEKSIGYTFKNKELLKKALRHKSYANERNLESNEKLEFLGDSILEFLSSKYIYENYKYLTEGEMTKVRATVVCGKSLSKIARLHNFSDFLYLGKSEQKTSGANRPAILEDSVEAIIAAINGDLNLGIAITIIYAIILIVRQLVEPKIVSNKIGIHPIFTLIAMYTGFRLIGVLGLFVGPIILIILKNIFRVSIENGIVKSIFT